jgi:Uma2 family endonuclease
MAEPAWKMPTGERWAPEPEEEESVLQRWVELPDGRMELLELPLTPELYLDPEIDDKMVQGERHVLTCMEIFGLLRHHFRHQPDTLVVHDMKHLFGRGLSAPSPDVSVVHGLRPDRGDLESYDARKHGVVPSLVAEVVSPMSARIRHTDLTDKVRLYERVGIREYFIVDTPRRQTGAKRYTLLGYRLDSSGRYQTIPLDAQGRLLSETTGVWFQIDAAGDRVLLFDATTGRRLLNLHEEGERAEAAEVRAEAAEERASRESERAIREAEARTAAEEEVARLRAEIERLRGR